MKREYVTPTAVCETFEANEYVAACESSQEWVYNFTCNAPAAYAIYKDDNGVPGIQTRGKFLQYSADTNLIEEYGFSSYHPCGEPHQVKVAPNTPASAVFDVAYYSDGTPVYFWDGEGHNNVHFMSALNPDVIDIPVVKS